MYYDDEGIYELGYDSDEYWTWLAHQWAAEGAEPNPPMARPAPAAPSDDDDIPF